MTILENIPFDAYKGWDCFHFSMVKAALRSPAHIKNYLENAGKKTKSLSLGSLVDTLVLEPESFIKQYTIQPSMYQKEITIGRGKAKTTQVIEKPWNNNSNTCKAITLKALNNGKKLITTHDYGFAREIRQSILNHKTAGDLVADSKKQVSIRWTDVSTGIDCKARLDMVHPDYVIDLKTTRDASPLEFARSIAKYKYHVQAAAYQQHFPDKEYLFIAAETSGSCDVAVYRLSPESIEAGMIVWRKALDNYKIYLDGVRSGYSDYIEDISLPEWQLNRDMALADIDDAGF